MKTKCLLPCMAGLYLLLSSIMLVPGGALAHCDTVEGPVVQSARTALETGDITPVLQWVRAVDEQEIRTAFERTVSARSKGPDVQELADRFFFETLVRIHRAGIVDP